MSTEKVNLLDFDRKGLRKFFAEELGEKAFRADQLMKWKSGQDVNTLLLLNKIGVGGEIKLPTQ